MTHRFVERSGTLQGSEKRWYRNETDQSDGLAIYENGGVNGVRSRGSAGAVQRLQLAHAKALGA